MGSDLQAQILALFTQAKMQVDIYGVHACNAGGNNRTYRVETSRGVFAVKQYFRHPGDLRDRLAAEFAFLKYANNVASKLVPTAYAVDAVNGIALYEFVEGAAYVPSDVNLNSVQQAAQFFVALNSRQVRAQAMDLPMASEACFSINNHLQLIERRLLVLHDTAVNTAEDEAAHVLVRRILEFWKELKDTVILRARKIGLDNTAELSAGQRCISPSDFGFHNALQVSGGTAKFLDFEYAGWDDPAKMTGDFFAQLALPVPADLFDTFVTEVMTVFDQPEALVNRACLLRPIYRIKWCCIALNIFLPEHLSRRRFANPALNETELKQSQLLKAANLFNTMESLTHVLH
jgi:hypothetical protein